MKRSTTVDSALTELARGVSSSAELARALSVSQPTLSRALRRAAGDERVLRIGTTRGARYARRRQILGAGTSWPLFRINSLGGIEDLGSLNALAANQYYFDASDIATSAGLVLRGLTSGLPYFLRDPRPDGFLGRAVPARYPHLQLPPRVADWTDDHYLRYLTRHGSDTGGDLILGDDSLNEYLASLQHQPVIRPEERGAHYPQLALEVLQGGLPGSSAHGEQPKFLAQIGTTRSGDRMANPESHVLVKFSPPVSTPIGRRWSDLLLAEHHAHLLLREASLPACTSRVLSFEQRTFLEVIRFDRSENHGRIGVTSLMAVDLSHEAALDNWIASAQRLWTKRRIDDATLEQIRLISAFAELIANTDRHFGNLAFYDDYRGRFRLAPVYDMLPMLFAPQNDRLPGRVFVPPTPTALTQRVWTRALQLAPRYWQALMEEPLLSDDFRTISRSCLTALRP